MGRLFGLLLWFLPTVFLFGMAGGVWGKRVHTSVLIGFVIGLLATGVVSLITNRSLPQVSMVMLCLVIPAVLGSLVGHKFGSYSKERRPVSLTKFFCGLALFAALVLGMLVPALNSTRDRRRPANCPSNLVQIGLALGFYADDHDGHLPPETGVRGLVTLTNQFSSVAHLSSVLHCYADKTRHVADPGEPITEDTCSYIYVPTTWQAGTNTNLLPVCWDKPGNHGTSGMNVLFNDGHVEFVTLERWEAIKPR